MRKTNEGFIVNESKEGIQIVKYTGTSEMLTIPQYIDSIPVISLEDNAFRFNMYLKIVDIPSGIRRMGTKCFAFSSVRQVYIDPYNNLPGLGEYAFAGCVDLERIVLPRDLRLIPEGAFMGCTKLRDIELPASLAIIEKYAFANCESLEYVRIPAGTEAEQDSFKDAEVYDVIFVREDGTEVEYEARATFLGYIDMLEM